MRQDRLSGDLSPLQTTTDSPTGCESALRVVRAQRRNDQGDIIGALNDFRDALQVGRNCYEAWLGLSVIFHDLADGTRAGRCLGIARTLRPRVPGITATV